MAASDSPLVQLPGSLRALARRPAGFVFLMALLTGFLARPGGPEPSPAEARLLESAHARDAAPSASSLTRTVVRAITRSDDASRPTPGPVRPLFLFVTAAAAALVAHAGTRASGPAVGWIAGALLALAPLAVHSAGRAEAVALQLMTSAGALAALAELARAPRPARAAVAGAAIGLATGAAPEAIAFLAAVPLAASGGRRLAGAPGWLAAGPFFAATLLLAAPGVASDPWGVLTRAPEGAIAPAVPPEPGAGSLVGPLPIVLAALGAVAAGRRGRRIDRALIVGAGLLLALTVGRGGRVAADFAACLPALLLLAALALTEPGQILGRDPSIRLRRWAVGVTFLATLLGGSRVIAARWTPSPSEAATAWVTRHVPHGAALLVERDSCHPRSMDEADESQKAFHVVELPPRRSEGPATEIYYQRDLARLFGWVIFADSAPYGARRGTSLVEHRERLLDWMREEWDEVARFDGGFTGGNPIAVYARPDDISAFEDDIIVALAGHPEGIRVEDGEDPGFPAWLVEAGTALRSVGRLRESHYVLDMAAERAPDDPEVHYQLGMNHLLQESPADSKAEFLSALSIESGHGFAHLNLGSLLQHEGDMVGAEVEYRAAILYLDEPAPAHAALGALLWTLGDSTGAHAELEILRRLDRDGKHESYLRAVLSGS